MSTTIDNLRIELDVEPNSEPLERPDAAAMARLFGGAGA